MTKLSLLAAQEVVKMKTSSGASDDNVIKMMTFPFQWIVYLGGLILIYDDLIYTYTCSPKFKRDKLTEIYLMDESSNDNVSKDTKNENQNI